MGSDSDEVPARRIVLVRHGHYERVNNLGDEVWTLSPLGRRQAQRTGRRLARLMATWPGRLEGLYSSPWPRAFETAQICARELDLDRVSVKPYLHECIPLVPPRASPYAHPSLPITDDADRAQVVEQVERVRNRFMRPARKPTTTLIFTHGNLIRYLVADLLELPYEIWMRLDCCHAALTEIRVYTGGFSALISHNDIGHMPPEMVSS